MEENIGKINFRDLLRGLILSVGIGVLSALQQVIAAQGLRGLTWESMEVVATAAATGFLSYLLLKLSSDREGRLGGKL